jgi:hypothetical protein
MHWLDPEYLPKLSGTFEAKRLAHVLSAGKKVAVRGDGLESALGTVLEARELGASPDDLHALKQKKPKRPKDEKHPHHA